MRDELGAFKADRNIHDTVLIAARSVKSFETRQGTVTNVLALAGTDLGDDLAWGGTGDNQDTFRGEVEIRGRKKPVEFGSVKIGGVDGEDSAIDTLFAVGVDPRDNGVFGDGNDLFADNGRFKSVLIKGRVLGTGGTVQSGETGLSAEFFGFAAEELRGAWNVHGQRERDADELDPEVFGGPGSNAGVLTA